MKISKSFNVTLQSKIRLIFFAIASAYNLLLGLYLKDFLVLSQTLTAIYVFVLNILFGNGTHILDEECFFKTEHFAEGDGVALTVTSNF